MKKFYCVICGKYRKFKNPKTWYIFEKTLALSMQKVWKWRWRIFKEQEPIEIWKLRGLIDYWLD